MKRVICLLMFGLMSCILSAGGVEVTASGVGPTKREALLAAQRNAIEKGVGVLVDSQSRTDNLVVIEDNILTKARGYVKSFSVIFERKQTDGNWMVEINCVVADDKLKHSLKALGILRDKMGNPRTMVVHETGKNKAALGMNNPVVSEAYEGIVEYLTEREFPVVRGQPDEMGEDAAKIAEYTLKYSVTAGIQSNAGMFKKVWVMISTRIINNISGQIIAAQGKKAMGVDKDSVDFAYRKAARKAGRLAAQFLELKLVKRWHGETVSGRPVVIRLVNITDFALLMEFKSGLKKSDRGVKQIIQRQVTKDTARIEVTYVGDIDRLKESAYNVFKEMGITVKMPLSEGNRILFLLPEKPEAETQKNH